ncbi:hypothetical protein [Ekhidna sp. To15]|uniref:hypothetical protein n=1 Tax=Ekhidna sp. To15 TaxID=3395267 RepID=UPI003F5211B9
MDEREKKEERNKRIGWLTSVGVQLLLLILFYFIVAWREPFPPIPEYGIELGFTTSAGAPAASSPAPQAPETNDEPEEVQEEQATSQSVQEVVAAEESNQEAIVNEVESPVKVEESKPAEPTPAEEKKEVDSRAVMTPSETDADESKENPSEGKEEEKEVDQRAIYGSQGTNTGEAEGANLALSGWVWDFKPKPDDQSDQSGKIVYKIVVDGDGYLVKIETETSTVSPAVERKYRQAVEKLTFSKTADYKAASVSTGTITFIIKSK